MYTGRVRKSVRAEANAISVPPGEYARKGETQIGGKSYFFDEGYGLSSNSWISRSDGSWSYAESDGSFHSVSK